MSKRVYIYAVWCTVMIGLAIVMCAFAWSPFADGARSSGGGYYGNYGPSHK
jgi:hypothetical protein